MQTVGEMIILIQNYIRWQKQAQFAQKGAFFFTRLTIYEVHKAAHITPERGDIVSRADHDNSRVVHTCAFHRSKTK